jgi:hypothetical protein
MSSVNNFIKSITSSFPDELSPLPEIQPATAAAAAATTATSDGTDFFSNVTWQTWIIIILILILLGINIFVYLAKGTQDITGFFGPLLEKVFGLTIAITGDVVDVTAEGTKTIVNATVDVVDKGLTTVQNITPNTPNSNFKAPPSQPQQAQPDLMANNTLNKALNTSQSKQTSSTDFQADESSSNIQGGTSKSGWCYIGEDRGFRSCAQVGDNDKCMSGDIFPTQEVCVNPNLRT